jgi:hypothetical protein
MFIHCLTLARRFFQSLSGRTSNMMDSEWTFGQRQTPSIAEAFHRGPIIRSSQTPSTTFRSPIASWSPDCRVEERSCGGSWDKIEEKTRQEIDATANAQFRRLRSKLRHLSERVNESDRSAARMQRLVEEMMESVEQREGQSQGNQTPKTTTRVMWRRGQGTTIQRF